MLPRVVLRVRRAVRRWSRPAISSPETEASWQRMLARTKPRETEAERRMAEIERELNRLGLD